MIRTGEERRVSARDRRRALVGGGRVADLPSPKLEPGDRAGRRRLSGPVPARAGE